MADETTVLDLKNAADDYAHTLASVSSEQKRADARIALEEAITVALAAARAEGVRGGYARAVEMVRAERDDYADTGVRADVSDILTRLIDAAPEGSA